MAYSPSRAFVDNDEENLTQAEISYSKEWDASHSNLTMSNPTLSIDILAGGAAAGGVVDATIDPALLTQRDVSNDILAYDAPVQQP